MFSEKSVQGRAPESTSVSMRAEEELAEEPENELPESYEGTRRSRRRVLLGGEGGDGSAGLASQGFSTPREQWVQ